jgi:hypothetical protein
MVQGNNYGGIIPDDDQEMKEGFGKEEVEDKKCGEGKRKRPARSGLVQRATQPRLYAVGWVRLGQVLMNKLNF